MYELIKTGKSSYYIDCPSKIGIIDLGDGTAALIDSGNGKDTAKKVKRIVSEMGLGIKSIYNTHSHADHIGGNKYLTEQTGCKVYARGIEADFTRHPIFEPAFLFGARPMPALKSRFLLAEPSPAEELTDASLPEGISAVELPGHSFDMLGFRTPDGVFFIADALSSRNTLDKYGIGYIYDIGAYIETLERLKNTDAALFVPSHAEPTDNIAPLAQYNIDKTCEIADKILDICNGGECLDNIIRRLFDSYSLPLTVEQYALVGSSVRSYLSWLNERGEIGIETEKNTLIWKKA